MFVYSSCMWFQDCQLAEPEGHLPPHTHLARCFFHSSDEHLLLMNVRRLLEALLDTCMAKSLCLHTLIQSCLLHDASLIDCQVSVPNKPSVV